MVLLVFFLGILSFFSFFFFSLLVNPIFPLASYVESLRYGDKSIQRRLINGC